jgi:hypothetical protein
MKRWLLCLAIAGCSFLTVSALGVELTLYPAVAENSDKYRLVPAPTKQKNEDAVPLYAKVVQLLPKDFPSDQIGKWRGMPLDKLPMAEVNKMLQATRPSLQMLEQAAKCRQCNWPVVAVGVMPTNLQQYRWLAFALAIQARMQIAQGQYEQAASTIRTGFAMAGHIGRSPNLIHGLTGIAIAAIMCQEVEKLIQDRGAPNLYWALRGLPRPVVDISPAIGIEKANLQQYKDPAIRKQYEEQLKPAHDKTELAAKRLDRHVAVLQCIEAIRHFAATHDGKLPDNLASITEMPLPEDPVTDKPFVYKIDKAGATLEGLIPKGGNEKDTIRYELKLNQ